MKFSVKQRKAIDYNAFNRYCDAKNDKGVIVWGKALLVSSIKAMICSAENGA